MPTNPTSPDPNASVDRLTLGVDSPRGAQPSAVPAGCMLCFEAEASNITYGGTCFDTE